MSRPLPIHRREIGRSVSDYLWSAYHDRPGPSTLIFPYLRNGTRRVSEQESRILITQWLENHNHYYSIETPTTEKYRQTGTRALSARIDVTVYSQSADMGRRVNIELKSGTPEMESFRKDFEKLLREGLAGLWFHTLESANRYTWDTIEERMSEAFRRLRGEISESKHTIVFCFCVLQPPQYVDFEVDLSQDFDEQWPTCFRRSVDRLESPDWWRDAPRVPDRRRRSVRRQRKLMVYSPEIYPESFVHLSIKGESYRIRAYAGPKRFSGPWQEKGVSGTSELFDRVRFAYLVDVAGERKNLDSEVAYWKERTVELNRKHGIGQVGG